MFHELAGGNVYKYRSRAVRRQIRAFIEITRYTIVFLEFKSNIYTYTYEIENYAVIIFMANRFFFLPWNSTLYFTQDDVTESKVGLEGSKVVLERAQPSTIEKLDRSKFHLLVLGPWFRSPSLVM